MTFVLPKQKSDMRAFFSIFLKVQILALLPMLAFSQQPGKYAVQFHAGNYTPQENIRTVTKDSSVFQKSLFDHKYYVALQFNDIPKEVEKQKLNSMGIRLMDYIPGYTYTAVIPENTDLSTLASMNVRCLFQMSDNQKTVPEILSGNIPAHALKGNGMVEVTIITYEQLHIEKIIGQLNILSATIIEDMPMYRSFVVRVPVANINQLISQPFVQWVEPIDPPNVAENVLGRTLHRANTLNDGVRNLKGEGVKIGIWDGGETSPHIDFTPLATRLLIQEPGAYTDHGTHVTGTIGGGGIKDPRARGMAPKSTLYGYNFTTGTVSTEMFNAITSFGLSVSSHSYGASSITCTSTSHIDYSSTARSTDINLNTFPFHLHVHSAGNSQATCTNGWKTITGSGKPAKNNIVVANVSTTDAISSSSSFGPVSDGRIKPEISGFGSSVYSTYIPLNSYGTISGTSMSTPGISGTLALLVQRYRQLNANADPISSLIKGVACNTAHDLGNVGPDYKFGFGRINALAAVKAIEQNRYVVNNITQAATVDKVITVPAGAERLRVMLTWNDPAAATNSNPALVNNLDLSVISSGGTTLPWKLDPANPAFGATKGVDNISNIEQVTIDNPPAGNYTLRVEGSVIAVGANQQYSLTWDIDQPFIEVTYPNGGESFDPTTTETITWNNSGIIGGQTVEYSLDNGTSWVTFASGIPSFTTRLAWTIPSVNTSKALIRVSSGSISDVSDATFRIIGTPKNLAVLSNACIAGALTFDWTPVTNATHYDLYRLDMATGDFVIQASDISTIPFVATGLTPNANMWFTIRAKNNTEGSVSERAIAINAIVPSTGLAQVGAITGLSNFCGNTNNVTFSVLPVSGANNFVWTVPSGGNIVSGQGTTNILVNFSAASVSGNIEVYASNGVCKSDSTVKFVLVKPSPAITLSPIDPSICAPGNTTLSVTEPAFTGGISTTGCASNTVNQTIGTYAGENTATTYPAIYANSNESAKSQLLLRATELSAMGIVAGTKITSLAFDVTNTNNCGIMKGFSIRMANINNTVLLGMNNYSAAPVLLPINYQPVAGINSHTLDYPFIWDGFSSLLIEMCHNNDLGATNERTTNASVKFSTPGFNGYSLYTANNVGSVCGVMGSNFTAPSGIIASRPLVIINGCTTPSIPSTFAWAPAAGLNATTGASVTASPASSTSYTVIATGSNGCTASANTVVSVANTPTSTSNNGPVCVGNDLKLFTSPATTNKFNSIKISEVTIFRSGTGATVNYPAYIPPVLSGNGDDFIEISNVDSSNPVNMAGVTFEFWGPATAATTLAFNRSYIFPAGAVIPPKGVLILFLGSGTDDPTNLFYNTGGIINPIASSSAGGFLLKSGSTMIDVVATNSGIWPAASGVTAADWSGNIGTSTNLAGVIRSAAIDNNTAANWALSSASNVQTIGTYNGNYTPISPYLWTGPNGFTSTSQNPVISDVINTNSGTYNVTIAGGNGCGSTGTTNASISAIPADPVSNGNVAVCAGLPLSPISVTVPAGVVVKWFANPIGGSVLFTGTSFTPSAAGTYYAEASNQTSGCSNTDRTPVSLTVNPLPAATATAAGTTTFCTGGSVMLNANTGTGISYQWKLNGNNITPGGTGATYTATLAGSYTVTVTSTATSCNRTSTPIIVTVAAKIAAPVITMQVSGNVVTYSWTAITGATSYVVSIDDGATLASPSSGPNGLTHTVTLTATGQVAKIWVKALGILACANSDFAISPTYANSLFIPNAFTPNGDGNNDTYIIPGNFSEFHLRVLNNNGVMVYNSKLPLPGWDGKYKGSNQPAGAYTYILRSKLTSGIEVNKTGVVYIVR